MAPLNHHVARLPYCVDHNSFVAHVLRLRQRHLCPLQDSGGNRSIRNEQSSDESFEKRVVVIVLTTAFVQLSLILKTSGDHGFLSVVDVDVGDGDCAMGFQVHDDLEHVAQY